MAETRYDVLLEQLEYIKKGGKDEKFKLGSNGKEEWINQITIELSKACLRVDDGSEPCKTPCYVRDGMCICG